MAKAEDNESMDLVVLIRKYLTTRHWKNLNLNFRIRKAGTNRDLASFLSNFQFVKARHFEASLKILRIEKR